MTASRISPRRFIAPMMIYMLLKNMFLGAQSRDPRRLLAQRAAFLSLVAVLQLMTACADNSSPTPPTATPAITLSLGASAVVATPTAPATVNISVVRAGGFTGDVSLTAGGLPTGVTASFTPVAIGSSATTSTMTLNVGAGAASGSSTITVSATGSGVTVTTATVLVTISVPAINLTVGATTATAPQGASATLPLTLERTGGFTGAVNLSVEGLPANITGTFAPASVAAGTTSSTLTLNAAANATPGTSTITVRASGSGIADKTVTVQFTVTSAATPDFTLTASPAALSIAPGASAQSSITLTRSGAFAGNVAFTTSTLPAGVTTTFTPNPATANTSALVFATTAATVPGTYTITITGSATGVTARTVNIILTVTTAPGFSATFATNTLSIPSGGTGMLTATLVRSGGFAGTINFSVSGLPSGVTATVNPAAATGTTATVNVAVAASVAPGSYSGSLNGTATGLPSTATPFTVTVTGGGSSGGNIQWDFCSASNVPLFLAVRSGTTGAWTRVTPTGNKFTFNLTQPVGGVAYIRPSDSGFTTTVLLRTASELAATEASECTVGSSPSEKTITGTVTGLTAGQSAEIDLGYVSSIATFTRPSYTLTNVSDGPLDLVAARSVVNPATFQSTIDKLIIRRGLNQATGSTIAPLDFNTVEAFALVTANLTIGNLGSDSPIVGSIFNAVNGTSVSTGTTFSQGTSATWPIHGVPTAKLVPSDVQEVSIIASTPDFSSSRTAVDFFREIGDRTINLGPALASPTITTSGGTAPRPRAQGTIQTEYQSLIEATFSQDASNRTVNFDATKGYLGAATQYDFEVPDLTGLAGYNPSWSFTSGATITYSLSANNLLGPVPSMGDQWRIANRRGTVSAALRR